MLCKANARVTVIAKSIGERVKSLSEEFPVTIQCREFNDADVSDQRIIIAATNDKKLNNHISKLAKKK